MLDGRPTCVLRAHGALLAKHEADGEGPSASRPVPKPELAGARIDDVVDGRPGRRGRPPLLLPHERLADGQEWPIQLELAAIELQREGLTIELRLDSRLHARQDGRIVNVHPNRVVQPDLCGVIVLDVKGCRVNLGADDLNFRTPPFERHLLKQVLDLCADHGRVRSHVANGIGGINSDHVVAVAERQVDRDRPEGATEGKRSQARGRCTPTVHNRDGVGVSLDEDLTNVGRPAFDDVSDRIRHRAGDREGRHLVVQRDGAGLDRGQFHDGMGVREGGHLAQVRVTPFVYEPHAVNRQHDLILMNDLPSRRLVSQLEGEVA